MSLVVRLITDGYTESNPGPTYVIEKVIHGLYHQGNHRFFNTAGVQCAIDMLSIFAKHKNSIRRKNYQNNSTNICKRKRKIYSENTGTPLHNKLKAKKRLQYEQVCARKNQSPAQGYDNMQGKRKARELYLQTKMDSQVVLKPKSKKGLIIFVLFATVISLKTESYGDVNAVQFSFVMSYDGHLYICRACDKTMKRNFIP